MKWIQTFFLRDFFSRPLSHLASSLRHMPFLPFSSPQEGWDAFSRLQDQQALLARERYDPAPNSPAQAFIPSAFISAKGFIFLSTDAFGGKTPPETICDTGRLVRKDKIFPQTSLSSFCTSVFFWIDRRLFYLRPARRPRLTEKLTI